MTSGLNPPPNEPGQLEGPGQGPGQGPAFQPGLEAIEGYHGFGSIPPPVNPLQAQTAFERRARNEDFVAHCIAIIQTSGFFLLAFAALLGFVNISNAATATFLGTVMGYAVGKVDPILTRYFALRGMKMGETTSLPPGVTKAQSNGGSNGRGSGASASAASIGARGA